MPVIAAVRDNHRSKIVPTKVRRYKSGKAPEWAEKADESEEVVVNIKVPNANSTNENDLRLHRLGECRIDNLEEVRAEHMGLRKDEILCVSITEYEKEEFDEDAMEERRRRMREKSSRRQKEECLPIEEEDEYEMDSVDDVALLALAKPEFVPKKERETLAEREKLEAKKLALEENEERRRDEMKIETKKMLVEEIKKEEIEKLPELSADVDTDNEVDGEEEYKAWVMREVAVIRREREERDRLRNVTEEERGEWERENPRPRSALKRKLGFMQKDYHQGVFFQSDGDDIYRRDFSAPTGEDTMNKAILPKVMQVKRFGRSGRTKWTHLVNEDTTDWNSPWAYNDYILAKYNNKKGGLKPIAIRKRSKNLKDRITH